MPSCADAPAHANLNLDVSGDGQVSPLDALLVLSQPQAIAAEGELALPQLVPVGDLTLLAGSPLHVPLNGTSAAGGALQFEVVTDDPELIETVIPKGNRSLRLDIADFGTMVFELFEQRGLGPPLESFSLRRGFTTA